MRAASCIKLVRQLCENHEGEYWARVQRQSPETLSLVRGKGGGG